MSRAYRITIQESDSRRLKAGDEIATDLEILDILPPEETATLLRNALKARGFTEQDDGTLTRTNGNITVTVDPCRGEVSVKAEASGEVSETTRKDVTGFDDVGPSQNALRDKVREQLRQDLDKKFEQRQAELQTRATEELEKHLHDLQPEIAEVVNAVTREALKQKARQMGTIKEMSEDPESGSLTIKVEV